MTKEISAVDVKWAKAKEIAVVGAGMAGLVRKLQHATMTGLRTAMKLTTTLQMTWLALNESGMTKLSFIEAAQRLGGRVHTAYFGDRTERQYQEVGPMRLPLSYISSETNETVQINDHRIVFQLPGKHCTSHSTIAMQVADISLAEVNNLNKNNSCFPEDFIKSYQRSLNGLYYVGGARKPNGQVPTIT
jgi:monoamine oxidase